MLKSTVRIILIVSGLAIFLASCQTTITTTTFRPIDKLVSENIVPIDRDDKYSIVPDESGSVRFLRYGESRYNDRISGTLVLRYDTERVGSNGYGTFYEGNADIGGGFIEDIYTFTDKDYPELYADLVLLQRGGYFLEVGGERTWTIPRGRLKYTGTNIFAVEGEYSYNRWGRGASVGKFEMTVDFDAGDGSIDGESPTVRGLEGSEIYGSFGVNTETGTFSGKKLTVRNVETRSRHDTEIYGRFHGSGARGITGIYLEEVEEHETPVFFGAIVGVSESD